MRRRYARRMHLLVSTGALATGFHSPNNLDICEEVLRTIPACPLHKFMTGLRRRTSVVLPVNDPSSLQENLYLFDIAAIQIIAKLVRHFGMFQGMFDHGFQIT